MTVPLPNGDAAAFVGTAEELGAVLTHQAVWHDNQCNWMGAVPDGGNRSGRGGLTYAPLGPDLYGGTTGVAWFLAALYAVTGEPAVRRTALGAIRQALARADIPPPHDRLGLFTGWPGMALAAAHLGTLLSEEGLLECATHLVRRSAAEKADAAEFDLLSGRAGAIAALVILRGILNDAAPLELAVRLGDELCRTAVDADGGWSWPGQGTQRVRNLTGLSHGAAGAGYALLELYAATGDARYRAAANRAFDYERRWFDRGAENWPDFRWSRSRRRQSSRPAAFATAWCHGAPGIALSRLRAVEHSSDDDCRNEAEVALETTRQMVARSARSRKTNWSLCHGLAGNAEVLLIGREVLGNGWDGIAALAREVAHAGIERYAKRGHPWPCGMNGETPNLMLGLAGIGYFYLRLAIPAIPSILLLRREAFAQCGVPPRSGLVASTHLVGSPRTDRSLG
jgi:lantibiotic biosynthesis protein